MALGKPKPWKTELKSYWCVNVPTAVGGTVPQWSLMVNAVVAAYNAGKAVTYVDNNSQMFYLTAVTASELRFTGRLVPSYPNSSQATFYYVTINRSTGAAVNHSVRVSQVSAT